MRDRSLSVPYRYCILTDAPLRCTNLIALPHLNSHNHIHKTKHLSETLVVRTNVASPVTSTFPPELQCGSDAVPILGYAHLGSPQLNEIHNATLESTLPSDSDKRKSEDVYVYTDEKNRIGIMKM